MLWPFDEVADHWDRLTLRSFAVEGEQRTLYQEGSVTTMLAPQDLIRRFAPGGSLACGILYRFQSRSGQPVHDISLMAGRYR